MNFSQPATDFKRKMLVFFVNSRAAAAWGVQ